MKILWIADFGLQHNSGGAQRTDSFVIQHGLKIGHEIIPFHYDTPSEVLHQSNYDMVVTGNLENLHRRPDVFNFIVSHPRHVRYEHDSNSYLADDARRALFGSAIKNIFLSDFHHKSFVHLYGDIFPNVELCHPYIDPQVFYDKGNQREDKTLYVGFFHFLKGTLKFIETALMNPDKKFVVAGWGEYIFETKIKSLNNVQFLGKVEHNEMPILYNKYKTMYYHPQKFEPFCRSVGEAILCGMETDTSENIGAVADHRILGIEQMRENCNNSPSKWWSIVT